MSQTNKDYKAFKPLSKKTKALLLSTIWQDDVFIDPVFKGNQDVVLTYEVKMKYLTKPIFEYGFTAQCGDFDVITMNGDCLAYGAVHQDQTKSEQQQDILDIYNAIQSKMKDLNATTRITKKEKTQREFVKSSIDYSRNKAARAKSGGIKCQPRVPLSDKDKAKLLRILSRNDIIITEETNGEFVTITHVKHVSGIELFCYINDRDNCTETIWMDGRIVAEMNWHISMHITRAQQKIRNFTLALDKRQTELNKKSR